MEWSSCKIPKLFELYKFMRFCLPRDIIKIINTYFIMNRDIVFTFRSPGYCGEAGRVMMYSEALHLTEVFLAAEKLKCAIVFKSNHHMDSLAIFSGCFKILFDSNFVSAYSVIHPNGLLSPLQYVLNSIMFNEKLLDTGFIRSTEHCGQCWDNIPTDYVIKCKTCEIKLCDACVHFTCGCNLIIGD